MVIDSPGKQARHGQAGINPDVVFVQRVRAIYSGINEVSSCKKQDTEALKK
jgi:hypothetical protein